MRKTSPRKGGEKSRACARTHARQRRSVYVNGLAGGITILFINLRFANIKRRPTIESKLIKKVVKIIYKSVIDVL